MISVIISGHGDFPIALKESSGMIFGEENNLIAVPFFKGEGIQTLQEKYHQALKDIPEEHEVLFWSIFLEGRHITRQLPLLLRIKEWIWQPA